MNHYTVSEWRDHIYPVLITGEVRVSGKGGGDSVSSLSEDLSVQSQGGGHKCLFFWPV